MKASNVKRANISGTVKLIGGLALAALALTGCQTAKNTLGMGKVVPDEFLVVTKAPLVIPPDFSLRPPAPGEPRPQELQPRSAARQALIGERDAAFRTEAETAFVKRAGGDRADPLARYVVDDEFGDLAYKDESFADKVLFWREPDLSPSAAAATQSAPVNSQAEAARIRELIGDNKIVISQRRSARFKLPGL